MKSLITAFIHYVLKYSFCTTKSPIFKDRKGVSVCAQMHLHICHNSYVIWTCIGYDKETDLYELSDHIKHGRMQ